MKLIIFYFFIFCHPIIKYDLRKLENLNGKTVGILSLPIKRKLRKKYMNGYSKIPASYVKWLEQAGLKIIPIKYDLSIKKIKVLLNKINGVLITGGATKFFFKKKCNKLKKFYKKKKIICLKKNKKYLNSDDYYFKKKCHLIKKNYNKKYGCMSKYMKSLNYIVKKVIEFNKNNKFFPLWGTCLGFEGILKSLSKFTIKRRIVNSLNHSKKIFWEPDQKSRYFIKLPKKDLMVIEKNNISYFNHFYGILPEDIKKNKYLKNIINIVGTTYLKSIDKKIVSIFEHKYFPIIGTQFHPEKIQFEHKNFLKKKNNVKAIKVSFHFAILFAKLISKSDNYFLNKQDWDSRLIYNYRINKYPGSFDQLYIFPKCYNF